LEEVDSKTIAEIKSLQSSFDASTKMLLKNVRRHEKIMLKSDIRQKKEYDQLQKSILEIEEKNVEIKTLLKIFEKNIIASKTDLKGKITYISDAFCAISGYSQEELMGKSHNIVRHPDVPKSAFKDLWDTIKSGKTWEGEVKNLKKDGGFYWVDAVVTPDFDVNNNIIGYSAIRQDITSKKEVEELSKNLEIKVEQRTEQLAKEKENVQILLNNAGQGFLYFNNDMKIGSEYSKEAKRIFDTDIEDKDITTLLFSNNESDASFLKETLVNILNEDEFKQDIFMSLLQTEFKIGDSYIEIEYKILDKENFMLILTDVTKTKKLAQKVKDEQQVLKMVVETVTTLEQFVSVKNDYEKFINNIDSFKELDNLSNLRKEIHTYKGLFAQKEMLNVVKELHDFETLIDESLQEQSINQIILDITTDIMSEWLEKDIKVLKDILGDDFFDKSNSVLIDKDRIEGLKQLVTNYLESKDLEQLVTLGKDIEKLNYSNIITFLKPYELLVEQLSEKLEKCINPLVINSENIYISDRYKPFINSIVHIFRNSVDHGIETVEKREELGKELEGTITCDVTELDNNLIIEISDDGQGIDLDKIKKLAIEKGIYTQEETENLSENEALLIIFKDAFSTSETISSISGRGVGLASILQELEKIDGTIKIDNKFGEGITFTFTIPFK